MIQKDDLNKRIISVLADATRALRVEELRMALGGMPTARTSQALVQCKEQGLVSCARYEKWSLTRKGYASAQHAPVVKVRVVKASRLPAVY
jgi:hypothetical protein